MKKRIFGMLLMGAMVIASMSMFTSCKDYDDDIQANKDEISALKSQLTSELTSIRTQLASDLAAAKSELSNAIAAKANQSDLDAAKSELSNALAAAKTELSNAIAAKADAAEIAALSDKVSALEAQLAGKADAAELTALAAKVSAIETQLAAIDDVLANAAKASDVADLKEQVVALATTLATQTGDIADLKAALAAIQNAPLASAEVQAEVLAAAANVGLQEAALELLQNKVAGLEAQVAGGIDKEVIDALKKDIADAKGDIEAIQKALGDYAKLSDLASYAKLTDLKGLAKASDLNAYAKLTDLANYVKTADLAGYAKTSDLAGYAKTSDLTPIKNDIQKLSNKVDSFAADINILKMFIKRVLTSLNFSPAKFYGGIEATDIFSFRPKKETMHDKWHYFTNNGTMDLSEQGLADYHISPANVDLTKFDVNFFTRTSEIVEPAAKEKTRSAADNGRIQPVYKTTDDILAQKDAKGNLLYWNAKTGILTVPFTASATAIKNDLDKSIANITALQLSKKDTTVTSDYALVYPSFAYEFLICDNSFDDADDVVEHQDVIGKDKGTVSSFHLHRNFSFLALSTTTATHEILYSGKFDITKVLETHYVDMDKLITDTVPNAAHKATAPDGKDSDAKVPVGNCHKLSADKLAQLGLHYEINIVDYTLGTTKTSESAHIELVEEKVGSETHVMAYPRNIKPNGTTDFGNPANASAVGRMPIVCIELKKGDQTVSFAWMKFLITQGEEVKEVKKTAFDLGDYYADCSASKENGVKWNDIEYNVYNKLVGMSKDTFDATYDFDQYEESTETEKTDDKTTVKNVRKGEQYKASNNDVNAKNVKFTKLAAKDRIGEIIEVWNASDQKKEDATTHVLKWRLYNKDFWNLYKTIKLDRSGKDIVNAEDVCTWVRYKRINSTDGEPAIYIKFTIPAGKLHFAKGELDGTKTLTYWYNLAPNSTVNAEDASKAREVRVNVPVPVPGLSDPADETNPTTLSNYTCPWGDPLKIFNNNVLTEKEFIKDLHDFFLEGKLSGKVNDKSHFGNISAEPEFRFTLPSTSIGNASFNANNGTWTVTGFTGKTYTLKLFENNSQIRISPYTVDDILCSLTEDMNDNMSVIKYHEGAKQDDILNAYGHDKLAEGQTFTAYIQIVVKDACAPIEFDDMWFNVRFLRPLDLQNPKQGLLPDAPNDWQYVDLAKYINVRDWREYLGDPNNSTGGAQKKSGSDYLFDFAYYQVDFDIDENNFATDAHLGTAKRDDNYTIGKMIDINDNTTYAKELVKTSAIEGLILEKVGKTQIRYKNNSGVTGGFHVYVPIKMLYIFGQDVSLTQKKYVTLGVTSTVEQPQ